MGEAKSSTKKLKTENKTSDTKEHINPASYISPEHHKSKIVKPQFKSINSELSYHFEKSLRSKAENSNKNKISDDCPQPEHDVREEALGNSQAAPGKTD